MTKQEAIRILEDGDFWDECVVPCADDNSAVAEFHDAIDVAISALRAQQEPMKPLGGEAAPGLSGPEARPRLDRSGGRGVHGAKRTYGLGAVAFDGQKYCGYCGRPLTGAAWVELERRINNEPNDLCKASAQLEPREISH